MTKYAAMTHAHICREQKCPTGSWQLDWRKRLPEHLDKEQYLAVQSVLAEVRMQPYSSSARSLAACGNKSTVSYRTPHWQMLP